MPGGRRGWILNSRVSEGTVEEALAEVMKETGIPRLNYNRLVRVNGGSAQAGCQIPQHLVVLSHVPFRPTSE